MEELRTKGGAQVGWVNASWPLATLFADRNTLRLSVRFLGKYEFRPDEVVEVIPYGWIPIIASGIKIVHVKADNPKRIIFWTLRRPQKLIDRIRETGFTPSASPDPVAFSEGFPFKWSFVVFIIVVWNILLITDMKGDPMHHSPGIFTFLAVLLLFLIASGVKLLPDVQSLVLRQGHTVGEVRPILSLVQIIAGGMSVAFGSLLLSGVLK